MKIFKHLTLILAILLITACNSDDDATPNYVLESDRDALIEIYNANTNNTLSWDITSTDVSTWDGVTVEDSRVAVLSIGSSNIDDLPTTALQKLTALRSLVANNNSFLTINVSHNINLKNLQLFDNNLTAIDVSNNTLLEQLLLEGNNLENLDVSMLVNLTDLKGGSNSFSNSVNIANGNNANMWRMELGSSTLSCVQVDAGATDGFTGWSISSNASYSTHCL
ncbi:hypothetical protein [Winogradskyella sp. Asnod2-B02-A]|uniref:hypothetical protein n=1 Tax=Winogradskyella sp. Asnod2-B02-A TaxID=3160583 RepID=UPI003866AA90